MNVIRQNRHQVETLTWLRAILLICAEGRKALGEVSEALRDGESIRTSCATYVAESFQESTMIDIANRLIAAGHIERVQEAGEFATLRSETLDGVYPGVGPLSWFPDDDHPANELFQAISDCEDTDELTDLGEYIASRFAPRPLAA